MAKRLNDWEISRLCLEGASTLRKEVKAEEIETAVE